jgi:prolyl-tRNA synthetase
MAADGMDAMWAACAGSDEDEKRVKEETTATLRCIPFEQPRGAGTCFLTGKEAAEVAIFAKAY